MELPADGRWVYDDPSGLPDEPLALRVPAGLRGDVETAAARAGVTPGEWLIRLVSRSLAPAPSKAV
ncbi:MAG TPA: hypothetical protein VII51_05430 [Gaiellaceae bacterium]